MAPRLLIKFPTRSRPDKFDSAFQKYQNNLSGNVDVLFHISMDHDDRSMNEPNRLDWFMRQGPKVKPFYGSSKSKIEAVNANVSGEWDILLLASDDMLPVIRGFDAIIAREMQRYFPDGDGVLHFNDGRVGPALNTLCIMGRKYYERFNYIYHPDYTSVFADNEFTDVSNMLNRVVYFPQPIIVHYWMNLGVDELYQRNESKELYHKDKEVYDRRKAMNFDLKPSDIVNPLVAQS